MTAVRILETRTRHTALALGKNFTITLYIVTGFFYWLDKRVIIIGAGVGGLSMASLLANHGITVSIFEKSGKVGGRTMSMRYRGHILDNGFHIMPFYKTSSVYKILKRLQILDQLSLVKVDKIAFYQEGFHKYPRGITDILRMSMVPFKSRLQLLKTLLPIAFSSYEDAEAMDSRSLTEVTDRLDAKTKLFFDAVCMLAFADSADRVSLGEFIRTMIRANPFRGGTSEFAYPSSGGYDTVSKIMASYVTGRQGSIQLSTPIKKIVVAKGCVKGVLTTSDEFCPCNCVVVSNPAYLAINQFFDEGVFDKTFIDSVNRLNKTTSVVEVHFCLSKRVDTRQVVFPVGDGYTAKGIFFISNISPSVSPAGMHLLMAGTPVSHEDAKDPSKIRKISAKMKKDMSSIYPDFEGSLLWERPMAWNLVEAVVKAPGMVWKQKMPHSVDCIKGLFFVGDSTVSYGIGTDSAAHSAILCYPKVISYLDSAESEDM